MKHFLISHRGNINGRNSKTENLPEHIMDLVHSNIQVEIDVWAVNGELFLGHDEPTYHIKREFVRMDGLWCHAKNLQALSLLIEENAHCFWHQEDDYTLTSRNYIWTYPDKPVAAHNSVIVDLSENWKDKNYICEGICCDFL